MFGRKKARQQKQQQQQQQTKSQLTYVEPQTDLQHRTQSQSADRDFSVLETVDGESTVLIGRGTKVIGEIGDCAIVEVQGQLEGNLVAEKVTIRPGGVVNGNVKCITAEVHGVVSGDIDVEELLDIRSTGRVDGSSAYGQVSIAAGGEIFGTVHETKRVEAESLRVVLSNGQGNVDNTELKQ